MESNLPIKCYDNLGETVDRYTVIFMNELSRMTEEGALLMALTMSDKPYHPQGVGAHVECHYPNGRVGVEIKFEELPEDCQKLVLQNLGIKNLIKYTPVQHALECEKVLHLGKGYLHDEDDDIPYNISGRVYCGRCHVYLGRIIRK